MHQLVVRVMSRRFKLAAYLVLLICSAVQAYTVQIAPVFLYRDPYVTPSLPYETTPDQAFADFQAVYTRCTTDPSGSTCYTYSNFHPMTTGPLAILYNNTDYYMWKWDQTICQTTSGGSQTCNTSPNWGTLYAYITCADGFGGAVHGGTDSNPRHDTTWCQKTFSDLSPAPPQTCKSCIGNSILGGTGLKTQTEPDYTSGLPGLSFVRTYSSDKGSWSSIATHSFVDQSQAYGTTLNGCYQSFYTNTSTSTVVRSCFPYVATASNTYQLAPAEGGVMRFSGPNNAVTQNADINDRVTQVTGGWQIQREDNSVELYNAAGSLLQKTLLGGRVITYTYSDSGTSHTIAPRAGLLLTASDPFGHVLSFQYTSDSLVSQMTDPAGGTYQYSYDSNGNLTSVLYPDSTSKTYVYNESANTSGSNFPTILTGITDETNTRFATFQYDSYKRGIALQYAGGVGSHSVAYQGTSPGALATDTDGLGAVRKYSFGTRVSYERDTNQNQPAASGSGTVNQVETLDSNGNTSQVTDYNGIITKYTYDTTRNLETSRTEAYSKSQVRTITTSWNSSFRLPALISIYANSTGTGTPLRTTGYTYDSLGNVLTKTVADTTVTPNVTRVWTYTYDSYGRMLTAKGPRTDLNSTTTYTYYTCTTGYQCGQLQTVTDPVGNVTTYNTYNAHGQPLTITDPNGVVTTLTYDARTRVTSRQVGTETTSFSYWPIGLLKQVTLPDGSYVLYTYDSAHRLTQISDGAGNTIQYTLDNAGNRTAEKTYDPSSTLHRTHTRAYNTLNLLYQDINAAGTSAVTTTYAYDNNANQTSVAAPLTRNTTNVYDPLNRLSQITDPGTGNTYFTYDANDNLTSVKDPRNLTTGYGYNGFGDLATQSSPDTGGTTNTYDSGGNLAASTDARGALATYTYDAANRVISIVYSKSGVTDQTLTFGYDSGTNGKGHLSSASDGNHSLSWTYDGLGRVTGKGLTLGTVSRSIGYGYTNADLTAIVTPSGQAVTYGYNTNHQITSIVVNSTTVLSGATYEPFGGVNGWSWGNSSTVSRAFNGDGLISQIITSGTTLDYTFDYANRIIGISDSSNSALTWVYGYDTLDRLTSATTSSITDGWTYDANGNRLTQTGTTPITFTVSATSNQITATSGSLMRTYTYDAAGNTTSTGGQSFAYNDRGRLASTSGSSTLYLYNALGQMIEKSGTQETTIFMQDEAGHVIGEYDGSGNLIQETVWLGDIPVAMLQPNGSGGVNIFYVHTDHLITPRKVSRPSDNQLEWRWDSDPFGTTAANQNPAGLGTFIYDLRFPGQLYQAETVLNQNYFRDYDPLAGRYMESDPIGLKGGINTFVYTSNRPIQLIDSLGLTAACERFSPLGRQICEACVSVYCKYGPAARACCDLTRDECINRSAGDFQKTNQCYVDWVGCQAKGKSPITTAPKDP
jgi:RHS repeat-associated protein